LLHIRERIAEKCAIESPLSGEVEVDESFFGARRVKGKRGRGAGGKTIGFNMAEMNLPTASPISTESKTSGGSLKCDWPSYLYLKECEFRFNHRGENLYKLLLKIIKKRLLIQS